MNLWSRLGRIAYWAVWPGSWLYLRRSRRARLLLTCGDEVLVVRNWLGAGKWNLPGGGLHDGEEPAKGLLREVLEETGIRLAPADIRFLAEEPYRIHGFSYQCSYFVAAVPAKPEVSRRLPEITAISWLRRQNINARNAGPDVLRVLQLLDSHGGLLIQ